MLNQGKTVVEVTSAPKPVGPYSQAVKANGFVFLAGQIPLDPKTGELIEGDTAAQARQCLKNIDAILDASGSNLFRVVKATIFLVDLADFAAVNAVYGEFFKSDYPARTTIQVAALPKGSRVEIEVLATYPADADSHAKQSSAFGGL
jgi:2-iminobutanoate/2-iminopropanoate deaminase